MVTYLEISVGSLPSWYNEEEHDYALEDAIEREWRKNPAYKHAEIKTEYNYQTDEAIVGGYNDDGDLIFSRDNHNIEYAFDAAKESV